MKGAARLRLVNLLIATAEPATTSAASPASAAPAAIPEPAASAKASAAVFLGTCLVHVYRAGTQLRSIHAVNGLFGLFIIGHLHKPEASRLASVTIFQNSNVVDLAVSAKRLAKLVFSYFEIQISYVDILHAVLLRCVRSRGVTGVTAGLVEDN